MWGDARGKEGTTFDWAKLDLSRVFVRPRDDEMGCKYSQTIDCECLRYELSTQSLYCHHSSFDLETNPDDPFRT